MANRLNDAVQALLVQVAEPGSENVLRADEVKAWLKRARESNAQEVERFPEEAGVPHWEMLIADYDSVRMSVFVASLVAVGHIDFLVGKGLKDDVRRFADQDYPENATEVLPELARRFNVARGIHRFSMADVESWIGGRVS